MIIKIRMRHTEPNPEKGLHMKILYDLPVNFFLTLAIKLLGQSLPSLSLAIVNLASRKTGKLKEVILHSVTHS